MKKLAIIIVSVLSILFSTTPALVHAQTTDDVSGGVCAGQANEAACLAEDGSTVNGLVRTAIRIFQIIVGTISVFMMIYGGLRFVLSSGDSSKIASAKNTILFASIGIAVTVLSEIIVDFVLNRVG